MLDSLLSNTKKKLAIASLASLLSSCTTIGIPFSTKVPILGDIRRASTEIKSTPIGARVYFNNNYIGNTPLKTEVEIVCNFFANCSTKEPITVRLELDGYNSITKPLWCSLDYTNKICGEHFYFKKIEQPQTYE